MTILALASPLMISQKLPYSGERVPDLVTNLQQMLSLFTSAILLCLIIAIITLAVVEILKPVMRGMAQYTLLNTWHSEVQGYEGSLVSVFGSGDISIPDWIKRAVPELAEAENLKLKRDSKFPRSNVRLLFRSVPNGLFMKQVQDAATLILARPSLSVDEYAKLTSAASVEDRNAMLLLDSLARQDPAQLAALVNPPGGSAAASKGVKSPRYSGFAEAMTAAQQAVGAAVERHLDELQLRLEGSLAASVRVLSVGTGVIVASLAALAVDMRNPYLPLVIGAIGGLLSSLLNDVARALLAARPR